MTDTDFHRLESKVDNLTNAINRLVLFEERQSVQAVNQAQATRERAAIRLELAETRERLDMWINRGIGAWGLTLGGLALVKVFL